MILQEYDFEKIEIIIMHIQYAKNVYARKQKTGSWNLFFVSNDL